jgi:phytoene desaturase
MKQKSAIVIGAGIGGMAIANLLAKKGWKVDVYEQQVSVGGRAGTKTVDGFTFGTGPSWYLMPEVFEHYFGLLGEKTSDHLDLVRLDPAYKVFFDYRDSVTIHTEAVQDTALFESIERGSGNKLKQYVAQAEKTYNTSLKHFLYNPFNHVSNFCDPGLLKQLPLLATQLLRPLHGYVNKFFKTLPLQQILEYQMVFLGASPFKAPALFHLMSYLDFRQGVFYPQGGMYRVIEAMQSIGQKLGVNYHFKAKVTKIVTVHGQATGIVVDGKTLNADIVISNADIHFSETKLLDAADRSYPQHYWDKKVAGPSALLMYLGIKGELPNLEHHNLLFVEQWRQNFENIFDSKIWPDEASIYVSRPSATDPSVAPKGYENVFVLVPLPAKTGIKKQYLESMADHYLDQLAAAMDVPDLKSRIVHKSLYGPDDFVADYNAWQGTALGMSHLLSQSAFFRPSPKSKKVKNLYYVGAGTQPGIGLPMCLINAEVIYKLLSGDHSNGPLDSLQDPKNGVWNV